ncbi:hypothetical protein TL16_g01611, partial [Triparma laevis f. inornata]
MRALLFLILLNLAVVESKFSLKNVFKGFRKGKEEGEGEETIVEGSAEGGVGLVGRTGKPTGTASGPTLCMLMLARDEALNVENHLPLYGPDFFDCYVLAVDSKTSDDTVDNVRKVMGEDKPGYIFEFEYEGLGRARKKCLEHAWREFSWASHIMFVDPDWKPVGETLNKQDLDPDSTNYFFIVKDRNGKTSRSIDWLVVHEDGIKMKYNWHEQWVFPRGGEFGGAVVKNKILGWVFEERDDFDNWHEGEHISSFSYERYIFELGELERDWNETVEGGGEGGEDAGDAHRLLYYLGFAHLACLEAAINGRVGKGVVVDDEKKTYHLEKGVEYLTMRAGKEYIDWELKETDLMDGTGGGIPRWMYGVAPSVEMSQATLQYLGIIHWIYKKDAFAADKWYEKCMEFNEEYFRCFMNRSQLYADLAKYEDAWKWGLEAVERTERPLKAGRSSITHGHDRDCKLPMHMLKVGMELVSDERGDVLEIMRRVVAVAEEKAKGGLENCLGIGDIGDHEKEVLGLVKARIASGGMPAWRSVGGEGEGVGWGRGGVNEVAGGWEGLGLSEESILAVERMKKKERKLLWELLGGKGKEGGGDGGGEEVGGFEMDFFTRIVVVKGGGEGGGGGGDECFGGRIGKIIQRESEVEVVKLYDLYVEEMEEGEEEV